MSNTPARFLMALDLVTTGTGPQIEALGAVRAAHMTRVRSVTEDKNVVAVGISEKEVNGKSTGELAVCFYVETKLSPKRLDATRAVPQVINLPGDKAVFTDVKEIGVLRLEASVKDKPIQSGFSVAHVKTTAGTVGAVVKRDGKLFILSNSHVLALSGKGKVGDQIVYPGPADGGTVPANLVGSLASFVAFDTSGAFVNRVDAALAEIDQTRLSGINFGIHKAVTPLRTILPKRGMKISKAGRTSGKTSGEVIDVNFRFVLQYPGVGGVGYIDQVLCSRYTEPGDSGSLVVDTVTGKIVGLHFAGANGGSVFNPIRPVADALKFKFVSKP
jgi:hypothetical protein